MQIALIKEATFSMRVQKQTSGSAKVLTLKGDPLHSISSSFDDESTGKKRQNVIFEIVFTNKTSWAKKFSSRCDGFGGKRKCFRDLII